MFSWRLNSGQCPGPRRQPLPPEPPQQTSSGAVRRPRQLLLSLLEDISHLITLSSLFYLLFTIKLCIQQLHFQNKITKNVEFEAAIKDHKLFHSSGTKYQKDHSPAYEAVILFAIFAVNCEYKL